MNVNFGSSAELAVNPGVRKDYEFSMRYSRAKNYEVFIPEIVGNYVELVGGITGIAEDVLTDRFTHRTSKVRVYFGSGVLDPEKEAVAGYFDPEGGAIVISAFLRSNREVIDNLAHEIGHALVVSGNDDGEKNGLDTTHKVLKDGKKTTQRQGEWLNEGLLSLTGSRTSPTDRAVGYLTGASVLSMLFEEVPGLEYESYVAAFVTGNKSKPIGMIENLMGPLWVDEVSEHYDNILINVLTEEYNPVRSIFSTLTSRQYDIAFSFVDKYIARERIR